MLFEIIAATVVVSLISLIGVIFIGFSKRLLFRIIALLVAFAVGAMLGSAFLHMLPESLEENEKSLNVFSLVVIGFILFFIIEKFIQWRHCHEEECKIHAAAYLNIIGDAVHNFIDGAVIATSFMSNIDLGIATTIAIILHEIPQELGDFSVLIHSGMNVRKALFYNLLSALTAVIGALISYFFISNLPSLTMFLVPIAAGGFIYIAAVDLIPELHKERNMASSLTQLLLILLGIGLMYYLKIME
jgi:zinc and cadmium transporter